MEQIDFAGLAAIILAVVTLYNTFRNSKTEKTKTKINLVAELQQLAEAATSKNVSLLERINAVECEMIEMKGDLKQFLIIQTEWYEGIQLLIDQLKRKGLKPVWEPDLEILTKLKDKYK